MYIYLLLTSVQHHIQFQMSTSSRIFVLTLSQFTPYVYIEEWSGRGGRGGRGGRRIGEMGMEDVRERRRNLNKCLNSSCDIEPFTTSHRKCCI